VGPPGRRALSLPPAAEPAPETGKE